MIVTERARSIDLSLDILYQMTQTFLLHFWFIPPFKNYKLAAIPEIIGIIGVTE